jgi:hypothetical protein
MTKDEALQMCLEYIETDAHERKYVRHAIKQALAAPVQEPVAWMQEDGEHFSIWKDKYATVPLYTTSPAAQRPWVELTELQLDMLVHRFGHDPMKLVIELTQELKEKNT